jgi:hypothetical protein
MFRGRWLRYLLPPVLVLASALGIAGPASAAQCGPLCTHYYADITISASVYPWWPVPGGTLHDYTVRVTNTGWRVGGTSGPMQWPGPDSGWTWVVFHEAAWELPIAETNDSGVPFQLSGLNGEPAYGATGIPTMSTSQFTMTWRTPTAPGTYTMVLVADSYQWTEYDETNNTLTLTYTVS